ncbi:hypothetical protein AB0M97_29610 [Streptomyces sp. NPDC051207]
MGEGCGRRTGGVTGAWPQWRPAATREDIRDEDIALYGAIGIKP